MAELFKAREHFSPNPQRIISAGELVWSDDPDYAGREHLFEPITASVPRNSGSETASAAPGERRIRSKTTKPEKSEETGS